jgi:hypothetical protein
MRDPMTLDLFSWRPPEPEPEPEPTAAEVEPPRLHARLRRSKVRPEEEEDHHRTRRRSVAGRQRELVFQVLRSAYPHPVSHATICEKVGTNRASHRIRELIQDGWSIEGAGVLGLDAGSQTQLYRLSSLERGDRQVKYLGLKVLWDQDGLKVNLHRDIDDIVDGRTLTRLARRIEVLVREELEQKVGAASFEQECLTTAR